VHPKTYQATTTPAALDGARAELAALILHVLGRDVASGGSGGGTTPCTTTACTDPTAPAAPVVATSQMLPGGGCSSSGLQSIWLALPVFAFALRRRRSAWKQAGSAARSHRRLAVPVAGPRASNVSGNATRLAADAD
jgi:hypothetical protein